jgi:hypothetical protein
MSDNESSELLREPRRSQTTNLQNFFEKLGADDGVPEKSWFEAQELTTPS